MCLLLVSYTGVPFGPLMGDCGFWPSMYVCLFGLFFHDLSIIYWFDVDWHVLVSLSVAPLFGSFLISFVYLASLFLLRKCVNELVIVSPFLFCILNSGESSLISIFSGFLLVALSTFTFPHTASFHRCPSFLLVI